MIADLLLVARDWQTRALTLAELKEAGYEVTAVPGLRYARDLLERRRIAPPIIILDVHEDSDATPDAVERLVELAPQAAVILITSVFSAAAWARFEGRATVLRRPVAIGDIVGLVQRLRPPG